MISKALFFCPWLQQPALIPNIRAQQGNNGSSVLQTLWLLSHGGEENAEDGDRGVVGDEEAIWERRKDGGRKPG